MEKMNEIIQKIKDCGSTNLYGIILVGSRAREDFDNYSDYDLVCIYQDINSATFSEGTHLINEKIYGFRNIPYDYLANKKFTQIEKHAYNNSKILFENNDIISSLIRKKCTWDEDERLKLFTDYLVKISYSYNVLNNYKNCWNHCQEIEKAIARNNKIQTQIEIFDFMRYAIYLELLNKKIFLPPNKVLFSEWTLSKSIRIKKIQDLFLTYEKEPLKFVEKVQSIITTIVEDFEREITLPEDIYKYRIGVTRKYE